MFSGSGITLPKTSSNSYRLFALPASRVRVRGMCPGAVLNTAPDITVLRRGGRQEGFAPGVTKALAIDLVLVFVVVLVLDSRVVGSLAGAP
jgi:hypothetical protein